jgi:predicted phosphodiesterase
VDHYNLVKRLCQDFRGKTAHLKERRLAPAGKKRIKIISVSDLHVPFQREDLLHSIIAEHRGADFLVLNGDLFDSSLISKFPKEREIPFAVEYAAAFEIVAWLSQNFQRVVLIDGNHDAGRFTREIGKLNPTILFLVKGSPLKYIADGRRFSPAGEDLGTVSLPNVSYAGDAPTGSGWWWRIGKVIFAHRLRGFKGAPMANAVHVAEWFLRRGEDFQCIVNGHSHHLGMAYYRGRLVIDQGALTLPMAYEEDGSCNIPPPDLGYAIVTTDQFGNVDPRETYPVHLGTYE